MPSTASPSMPREAIRATDLVANPGCYPTTAQLPLWPLLKAGLIDAETIIIDAKSGVTGAGRAAKESSLFTEVSEGLHAYGVSSHRHTPEIEQGLSTPPAGRSSDLHAAPGADEPRHPGDDLRPARAGRRGRRTCRPSSSARYQDEPFARVLPFKSLPATRHVRSTNACLMAVHPGRTPAARSC